MVTVSCEAVILVSRVTTSDNPDFSEVTVSWNWAGMFSSGAANKLFLITSELFGNGRSSSPSNTPEPLHGPRFPLMTIRDNVNAVHQMLTEQLAQKPAAARQDDFPFHDCSESCFTCRSTRP